MSYDKMDYLPDDDDSQQQMEDSEREQYEKEYEEWLDKIEEKSKLNREEQHD